MEILKNLKRYIFVYKNYQKNKKKKFNFFFAKKKYIRGHLISRI